MFSPLHTQLLPITRGLLHLIHLVIILFLFPFYLISLPHQTEQYQTPPNLITPHQWIWIVIPYLTAPCPTTPNCASPLNMNYDLWPALPYTAPPNSTAHHEYDFLALPSPTLLHSTLPNIKYEYEFPYLTLLYFTSQHFALRHFIAPWIWISLPYSATLRPTLHHRTGLC